jgi:hypothetical protein
MSELCHFYKFNSHNDVQTVQRVIVWCPSFHWLEIFAINLRYQNPLHPQWLFLRQ